MKNMVFDRQMVDSIVCELNIKDVQSATIGEVSLLATKLEQSSGTRMIRMDQGVPGLAPCEVGIRAEKSALDTGIAAIYPAAEGIAPLKQEASRFIKAFMDIDISPCSCVPVTGSVEGSFGSFIGCLHRDASKDTVLFIDPGFPIQKSQLQILGAKHEQFDIHDFRGEKLGEKLESYLCKGNIAAIIYSNPNNPAWICLREQELRSIGELATKYDAIVLEDLAYFGMDFREQYGKPFEPPYVPTVARYTDNYILMISASKIFSYAGQRVAFIAISDKLFERQFDALAARYSNSGIFGVTMVGAILYMITSGVTHSTQYGFAAMLKAATDGQLDFVGLTSEYSRRAHLMKEIFAKHGFNIVYDKDLGREISDGFFFTIGYRGMDSGVLMQELLYYGVSSISLRTTGSDQQGIRACCSRMTDDLYSVLDERLRGFALDHE